VCSHLARTVQRHHPLLIMTSWAVSQPAVFTAADDALTSQQQQQQPVTSMAVMSQSQSNLLVPANPYLQTSALALFFDN